MRSVFALLTCALLGLQTLASISPRKGFATTKNGQFQVDGKPFAFVGANSYWLPLLTTKEDVHITFRQMRDAGVKVLRTWGFNAINATELPGALESGLTYYQVWNGPEWKLNEGRQGLERLDYVIEAAGQYGIKVILAFTNNWVGYGGAELYVNWIAGAGATHDVFYSNPKIIASYQRYVKTIVNRYKDSPNVFAWELMNEARCLGDLRSGPNCPAAGLLTRWYKQQSDFVRSLDPYHLITTGGEGHFWWKNKDVGYWFNGTWVSDYNYNGQAGEDFDEDLALKNIDFGTYHIYAQYWYTQLDTPSNTNWTIKDWGLQWIQEHADAAKKARKPLVLEEFGLFGYENKTVIFKEWVDLALKTNHAGIMPWQFGALGLKEGDRIIKYADALIGGASPDDGHAVYSNQTVVYNIFKNAAKVQAARSR